MADEALAAEQRDRQLERERMTKQLGDRDVAFEEMRREMELLQARAGDAERRESDQARQLSEAKGRTETISRRVRWAVCGAVWLLMISGYLTLLSKWQFLTSHPKKIGLSTCVVVAITSLVSLPMVREKKIRWGIFGATTVAAVLALAQLI